MHNEKDNPEKVLMCEVRKCLKAAKCYDPIMTNNEMMDTYKALKKSTSEETEINCSMLAEIRRNSVPVYCEKVDSNYSKNDSNASTSDINGTEKRRTRSTFTSKPIDKKHAQHNQNEESIQDGDNVDVFNSILTTQTLLQPIVIKPLYKSPFYCNPKLENTDCEQKARLIAEHHLNLLHKYATYQSQSLISAPWGKAIQPNSRFNGNLMRKIEKTLPENEIDMQDFIQSLKDDGNSENVSQSGNRLLKRKLYCLNIDNNEPKRNKHLPINNDQHARQHQTRKQIDLLENEVTTKQPKLFVAPTVPTRTEQIFDKLVKDVHTKKTAEEEKEEIQRPTETLKQLRDEENIDVATNDVATSDFATSDIATSDVATSDVAEIIPIEEPAQTVGPWRNYLF